MWKLRKYQRKIKPDDLSQYLDGRLEGTARKRVENILASSPAVRQELESLRATRMLLQQMPADQPRRSFVMDTAAAVAPAPTRAQPQGRPSLPLRAPQWVYAGAASVALMAFTALVSADATGVLRPDAMAVPQAVDSSDMQRMYSLELDQDGHTESSAPFSQPDGSPETPNDGDASKESLNQFNSTARNNSGDPEVATPGSESSDDPDRQRITTMIKPPKNTPAPSLAPDEPPGEDSIGALSTDPSDATESPEPSSTPRKPGEEDVSGLAGAPTADAEDATRSTLSAPDASEGSPDAMPDGSSEDDVPLDTMTSEIAWVPLAEPGAGVQESSQPDTPLAWRVAQGLAAVLGLTFIGGLVVKWRHNRRISGP